MNTAAATGTPSHGPTTLAPATAATQWRAAKARARRGERICVIAPRGTWSVLDDLNVTAIAPAADPDNPLVEATWRRGDTIDGTMTLARPGQTRHGQAVAHVNGEPVASVLNEGNGCILLIAGEPTAGPALRALVAKHSDNRVEVTESPDEHPQPTVVTTDAHAWAAFAASAPETSDVNDPRLLRAAGHASRLLPADIHDALVDFADTSNAAGALLLRGVPLGHIPATPAHPSGATKPDRLSEYTLLAVARRIGQPVGYAPEHGGDLIQNISPTRAGQDRQVSTSSTVTLAYHTEAAFHPHRPRHLFLLCLRGDPQAATTLCSVRALTARLSATDLDTLFAPRFSTGIDESYTGERSPARSNPRPVLSGHPDAPKIVLDVDLMAGLDAQAQAALDRLGELTHQHGTSVTLKAGDLLVVDNDVAVHGRSPFTPRYDGTDRWLQRAMTVADHTAADAERSGRIIATEFRQR